MNAVFGDVHILENTWAYLMVQVLNTFLVSSYTFPSHEPKDYSKHMVLCNVKEKRNEKPTKNHM